MKFNYMLKAIWKYVKELKICERVQNMRKRLFQRVEKSIKVKWEQGELLEF